MNNKIIIENNQKNTCLIISINAGGLVTASACVTYFMRLAPKPERSLFSTRSIACLLSYEEFRGKN